MIYRISYHLESSMTSANTWGHINGSFNCSARLFSWPVAQLFLCPIAGLLIIYLLSCWILCQRKYNWYADHIFADIVLELWLKTACKLKFQLNKFLYPSKMLNVLQNSPVKTKGHMTLKSYIAMLWYRSSPPHPFFS